MVDERHDPFRSFNFRLEIDNTPVAAFSEVSGLAEDSDVVEYRAGTDKHLHVRKLVGLHKHNNITLKRGIVKDKALWDWVKSVHDGAPDRRNGAVILMDEQRNDVLRWAFDGAWPKKYSVSDFKASGNEVVVESIELVVEGMDFGVA